MQIDWWTLGLQTVNVLVLVWLLSRFFFRPIARMIATRQRETEAAIADAAAARQAAEAAQLDAESLRQQFADEHDKIVAEARAAGEAARTARVERAAGDIATLKASAEEAIAKERAAVATEAIEHARNLAVDIAGKLLAELPGKTGDSAFLDKLCAEVDTLSDDLKKGLMAADGGEPPEIVTAAPLAEADAARCREKLAATLGRDIPIRFRVDPSVLAGIELRGPHTVVTASWRGNLDRILSELNRDADRQ